MPKFVQNIVSVRFLEVLDELVEKGFVESIAEFSRQIDYQAQSMSAIRKGRRDVTIDLISKIFTLYKGNPLYILSGSGPKILSEEGVNVLEQALSAKTDERRQVAVLEELVKSKEDVILLLKEKIQHLENSVKPR